MNFLVAWDMEIIYETLNFSHKLQANNVMTCECYLT